MLVAERASAGDSSWVVVHDAWRDQYQLPAAFAEAEQLGQFVTDWYTPADRGFWGALSKKANSNLVRGLTTRYSPLIPSSAVTDDKFGFLSGLLRRRLRGEPFDDVTEGGKSGRRAAHIANDTGSHLLAASYSAAEAFTHLKPGLARVLFQVHPQPRYLRELYAEYISSDVDYAALQQEAEFSADERTLRAWEKEAELADHILCASSFSKQSLLWNGVPESSISVIPYGVDTNKFTYGTGSNGKAFRVLFVGQRVARKGLRSLLRVWKKLNPDNAELILAGGHQAHADVVDGFDGIYSDVPRVSPHALVDLYKSVDLFVLPSLAEGFGHVYLEALACGTPVICTSNTGAADLITPGVDGWTLPSGSAEALEEQLAWVLNNRDVVRGMRMSARSTAERYSWSKFRSSLRSEALKAAAVVQEAAPHLQAGAPSSHGSDRRRA